MIATICGLALLATMAGFGLARVIGADGRPVALTEARRPPTWLVLVKAGGSVTRAVQCPGRTFYSDVNAYRWDGGPLAPQKWAGRGGPFPAMRWGAVTFDGLTFRNHNDRPVLVAGWCE